MASLVPAAVPPAAADAAGATRASPGAVPSGGADLEDESPSYEAHRRQLLFASVSTSATVIFAVTLLYVVSDALTSPAAFWATAAPYLVQLTTPLIALALARWGGRARVVPVAFAADLVYTAALASHLLLAITAPAVAVFMLGLKMAATALFFPWSPPLQAVSAAATVVFYAVAVVWGAWLPAVAQAMYLVLGLPIAALFSVVGALLVDRSRRALFERGAKLAASQARLQELLVQQQHAEGALREREERLRLLLDQVPAAIWSTDLQLRFTSAVGTAPALLGLPPVATTGTSLIDYVGRHDPDFALVSAHQRALLGQSSRFVAPWRSRLFQMCVEPLRGVDGTIGGTCGVALDITEQKQAQERTATLLEIASDMARVLDLQELLAVVHRRIVAVLPCTAVATFCWDPSRELFRCVAQHGTPADLVPSLDALEVTTALPLAEALLTTPLVVVHRDQPQNLIPAEMLRRFRVTSLIAAPLRVRDRMLGGVVATTGESRHFDVAQGQLFEGIARQVAVAMERADLYEAQQMEADVSAALVRVGEALIAALDTPDLLERLCQITVEVVGCDSAVALLWRRDTDVFEPVAGFGQTPERWASLRALRVPQATIARLVQRLERDDLLDFETTAVSDRPNAGLVMHYGVTRSLDVALRRGDELVGILSAAYRGRRDPFSPRQQRIARGVGHLAALALESVRLLEELERANRAKSDFVGTMSHEWRTPLNVIIGYNDLLAEGQFGALTEGQRDTVQRVGGQARELLELVDTTLELSRLDAGSVSLTVEEVDVAALLAEIDAEAALLRRNPKVTIRVESAPQLPRLRTDPLKLRVILKNLLGNAMKFTDTGEIVVRAQLDGEEVCLAIVDTGVGIAAAQLAVIFEPFWQAEASGTRGRGAGLGLHIVHRLIGVLGGRVAVESEVGRGSTFRVWLPLAAAPGRVASG